MKSLAEELYDSLAYHLQNNTLNWDSLNDLPYNKIDVSRHNHVRYKAYWIDLAKAIEDKIHNEQKASSIPVEEVKFEDELIGDYSVYDYIGDASIISDGEIIRIVDASKIQLAVYIADYGNFVNEISKEVTKLYHKVIRNTVDE